MSELLSRIAKFNAGRIPALLALKYRKMAATPFGFFRGTCHLFHEDWPKRSRLNAAPLVWLNGDLHLENFGTYRSDNRLTYFDIGDFDEGGLGPATRDLARFVASLFVAAPELGLSAKEARALAKRFLNSYAKSPPVWLRLAACRTSAMPMPASAPMPRPTANCWNRSLRPNPRAASC